MLSVMEFFFTKHQISVSVALNANELLNCSHPQASYRCVGTVAQKAVSIIYVKFLYEGLCERLLVARNNKMFLRLHKLEIQITFEQKRKKENKITVKQLR